MTSRYEVFTPGDFPRHTYVYRKFIDSITKQLRDPEEDIQEALKRPGMIVQVSGPSKSGKTVALTQMVHESRLVRVPGSSLHSEDSLWRIAAAELGLKIDRRSSTTLVHESSKEAGAEVGVELGPLSVGANVGAESKKGRELSQEHSLEDNLFRAATDELVRAQRFLFIDDFHTVPTGLKRYVASQLKAAAERKVKVILAEVSHRADEPIEALQDLAGRIERIEFGAWSPEDLASIGRKGFEKLNVTINDSALFALADEASGSPQLMQRLCLNLCQELKIDDTQSTLRTFQLNLGKLKSVFSNAIRSIDYSGSIYALETLPVDAPHNSETFVSRAGYSITPNQLALAALALTPPRISLPFLSGAEALTTRATRVLASGSAPPAQDLLASVFTRMSETSQKPAFKAPALHFKPHAGVTILDSLFLYSLRWSGQYYDLRAIVDGPESQATDGSGAG